MKFKSLLVSLPMLLFVCSVQRAIGATSDMNVAFPNADRPGVVEVVSGEGDVTITGYDGEMVVISTENNDKKVIKRNGNAAGLKRISGTRFNVYTDDNENAVIIARPIGDEVDLVIKVPRGTSLNIGGSIRKASTGSFDTAQKKQTRNFFIFSFGEDFVEFAPDSLLGGVFNGNVEAKNIAGNIKISTMEGNITLSDISGSAVVDSREGNVDVRNMAGDMEISTFEGDITLSDASGSAVVNSRDGDVKAVFSGFKGEKPMAISTIDGDVDVTLPPNAKATVTASNVDGDVYTDFDIDLVQKVSNNDPEKLVMPVLPLIPDNTDGKQIKNNMVLRGFPGKSITGRINGGGIEILMKTLDGDIFIRKGK